MMDGVMLDNCPINPDLPDGFWFTPNAQRSADHMAWWDKPFIVTTANPHFPTGTRYDVYCLDGESSDRPTAWGKFGSLAEALERAREGPPWRKPQ